VMDVPKVHNKPLAQNRKASHDYTIEDTVEAGIVLQGTEIKSIRRGSANLKDSYARVYNGEMYVYNMHIAPYEEGNRYNHDPLRTLKLYIKHGDCKVLLGIARGKRDYDKRHALKEKEAKRDVERAMKHRY